jgi:hypothetical protein
MVVAVWDKPVEEGKTPFKGAIADKKRKKEGTRKREKERRREEKDPRRSGRGERFPLEMVSTALVLDVFVFLWG